MANSGRAWQRTLKNGKTEAFVSVGDGVSLRVIAEQPFVADIVAEVRRLTGAAIELHAAPPVIEGQTDIYEQLETA